MLVNLKRSLQALRINFLITGRQIAAARVLLGMAQPDLAARANISVPTLKRMEASDGPAQALPNNVHSVRRALEEAGIIFLEPNGEGAGVRLRHAEIASPSRLTSSAG